jgi:hypothetical protein
MSTALTKSNLKEIRERQLAQYIADMLLEMRNMAKSAGLTTLLGLLEVTYCEAFSVANRVELPEGELEKLRQLVRAGQESARPEDNGQRAKLARRSVTV